MKRTPFLIVMMILVWIGTNSCDYAKPTAVKELKADVTAGEKNLENLREEAGGLGQNIESLEGQAAELDREVSSLDTATGSVEDSLKSLRDQYGLFIPTPSFRDRITTPASIQEVMRFDSVHVFEWEHIQVPGDSITVQMIADQDVVFMLFQEVLGGLQLVWWADEVPDESVAQGEMGYDISWFLPEAWADSWYGDALESGTYYLLVSPWDWEGLHGLDVNTTVTYNLNVAPFRQIESGDLPKPSNKEDAGGDEGEALASVKVTVTDAESEKGIPGAKVVFTLSEEGSNPVEKITDSKGKVTMDLPVGSYSIEVTHELYKKK